MLFFLGVHFMLKCLFLICFTLLSASEKELSDAIFAGRLEFFKASAVNSPLPGASFTKVGGSYVYVSGIDYPVSNGVIASEKEPSKEHVMMAIGYFNSLKLPFMWWTHADLSQYGFTFGGILNGVALDLKNDFPEAPASIATIKKVDASDSKVFSDLSAGVFGLNPNAREAFHLSMNESMLHGDMVHFIAYIDDKPVGAVTLSIGTTGGIWNLATLPEYRNKGVGSALVFAALKEAKERNLPTAMAILMPKGMAWNLLSKLGFKSYHQFPFYLYGANENLEE